MPEKKTIEKAKRAKRSGKAPSTQAGAFVEEEIEHVRAGKHGARSTKQAIAIGLSKARRAGVKLAPPKKGSTSSKTRKHAATDLRRGKLAGTRKSATSRRRAAASEKALQKEGHRAASRASLAKQALTSANKRSAAARSASAKKAARTRTAAHK